jgi:hypothetical protein
MSSATRRFRYIDGQVREVTGAVNPDQPGVPPPAVSDTMGFPEQCLADRRAQLEQLQCPGIEFKRDPKVPEFYQVHGSSRKALEDYARRRNLVNRTGSLGGGVILSQDDLDRASALVSRDK